MYSIYLYNNYIYIIYVYNYIYIHTDSTYSFLCQLLTILSRNVIKSWKKTILILHN